MKINEETSIKIPQTFGIQLKQRHISKFDSFD